MRIKRVNLCQEFRSVPALARLLSSHSNVSIFLCLLYLPPPIIPDHFILLYFIALITTQCGMYFFARFHHLPQNIGSMEEGLSFAHH